MPKHGSVTEVVTNATESYKDEVAAMLLKLTRHIVWEVRNSGATSRA